MNDLEKIYDMVFKKRERAEDYILRKTEKTPKIELDKINRDEYIYGRIADLKQQRGYFRCDICFQKIKVYGGRREKYCVDHDHITGKIRGLLCVKCNHMLGFAEDNQEILLSAMQYLKNNLAV